MFLKSRLVSRVNIINVKSVIPMVLISGKYMKIPYKIFFMSPVIIQIYIKMAVI